MQFREIYLSGRHNNGTDGSRKDTALRSSESVSCSLLPVYRLDDQDDKALSKGDTNTAVGASIFIEVYTVAPTTGLVESV